MVDPSRLNLAVLAALAETNEARCAPDLRSHVESRLGKNVNRGALARALSDLAHARLISKALGAHAAHGGPARTLYHILPAGRHHLQSQVAAFVRLTRRPAISSSTRAFLKHPPAGSKTADAKRYGVDLHLLSRALLQSPQERYREAIQAMRAFKRYAQ